MGGFLTRRTSARVAALFCAALAASSIVPVADAAGGGGSAASRADVDAAVAFREKLGLRADRAFVAQTFGKRGFSSETWGVPLDNPESAELDRRADIQRDLGRALRRWADEKGFAGAYLDQRGRGRPVFLTTADPVKAKGAVARLLPDGANARFLRVRHSMAQLTALQERINEDLRAGALAQLGVVSTAIDARANAVAIGVMEASDAARADLIARYGDAVAVIAELPAQGGDACTARDNCLPAKAGLEIRSSYNGNNCTTGFLARVVGSPEPRILTAGHCIGKSGGTGTSLTWTQGSTSVGWAEFSTWADGADADVGILTPSSSISGPRNLLYRASSGDIASIGAWRATAAQVQGELLCRAGAVSGYHCGTVVLTNRTRDVDGHTIDHQWVVDFDACPGDSGAPYFAGNTAYGLHSDSTFGCEPATNQAWYSPVGWILETLKAKGHPVELCTTAACGADTNAWTTQGSLGNGSWSPHLINLDAGRVLAVGGTFGDLLLGDGASGTSSPELFDPATGNWSDTDAPPWAPATCDGQYAVRLATGRVLVGGGRNIGSGGSDACDGAHLYDPDDGSNGSWSSVADPPAVLQAAGAVLLADGRAFVTGGSGASGATSVAMAYSPSGNAWTTLPSAPTGALSPLVLALGDGRVLVSGGYTVADAAAPGYVDSSATHLYNPGSNSWATSSAFGAFGLSGTVLADGRAVIAGGQDLTWDGSQHGSFLSTVRAFNPATNSWSQLGSMRRGRAGGTLAELGNGLLLAAAGRVDSTTVAGGATRTSEAWDRATNAWYVAPALAGAHADPGGVLLDDGRMLVAGGGTSTTETYVPGDILPPTSSAAAFGLRTGSPMQTRAMPIRVTWTGSDKGGSGIGTYDLGRSIDGGAFVTIATRLTAALYNTWAASGHVYRFQVRARDWADNVGPWMAGPALRMGSLEQTSPKIAYSGTWRTNTGSGYSGGSIRYASTAGRSASYTFTGRGIAWVAARGPTRGSAKVYIDGKLAATISLHNSKTNYRFVAYRRSWGSSGKHTIKIVVSGTSGHPRVDLDVFELISNP
ncbi:MAG TPA: trypsin-like serine protease [Candidatus Limnocylindrales bacterium]|nr:trypsin-like serine protease [Candidatus Limnocylindrales bacterium]